ncbi:TetR/AcrR family transcriptional regulator [Frateuria defendens]|uniref:TetR/AcrR family transcriptional regulator n=1 Tax=Frateuria defendens TaxID=2219559 RepID=UPI00066FD6A3|nr:TetR/AcrR family transcriptional regulator [Frateuria defendens]
MSASHLPGKGQATRELILEAAYGMARSEGLEGLSIGTLAQGVGMSKSGVFAHFGSREDLQLAVLENAGGRFVDEVMAPALRLPRGLPRLRGIVERWFEWMRRHEGGCVLATASSEYDGRPGPLHDFVVKQQAEWREALKRAVGLAVESGELRADTDPGQAAFEIHALVLALHHDAGLFGHDDAMRRAKRGFERLLAGLRA